MERKDIAGESYLWKYVRANSLGELREGFSGKELDLIVCLGNGGRTKAAWEEWLDRSQKACVSGINTMQRKTRKRADGLLFGKLRNSKFIRYTDVNELKPVIGLRSPCHSRCTAVGETVDRETAHMLLAPLPIPAQVRKTLLITQNSRYKGRNHIIPLRRLLERSVGYITGWLWTWMKRWHIGN